MYLISKTLKVLASLIFIAPLCVIADDSAGNVQVSSLKVKERLQSMEQINVTAEKKQVAAEPESSAVAALLREAEAIEAAEEQDQSAVH